VITSVTQPFLALRSAKSRQADDFRAITDGTGDHWHAATESRAMKEDARVASNSFTKRTMSAPSISADSTAADGVKTGMQDLLRRMPSQYVLSSTVEDRNEHAQLVKELGAYSDARNKVCVSWRVEKAGRFALRLVFQDQLGSLALVRAPPA
jgi:hypothetical protein